MQPRLHLYLFQMKGQAEMNELETWNTKDAVHSHHCYAYINIVDWLLIV